MTVVGVFLGFLLLGFSAPSAAAYVLLCLVAGPTMYQLPIDNFCSCPELTIECYPIRCRCVFLGFTFSWLRLYAMTSPPHVEGGCHVGPNSSTR